MTVSNEVLAERYGNLEKRMDTHDGKCEERQKLLHAKIDNLTRLVHIGYGIGLLAWGIMFVFGTDILK